MRYRKNLLFRSIQNLSTRLYSHIVLFKPAIEIPYRHHLGLVFLLGCLFLITLENPVMAGNKLIEEKRFDSVGILSKVKARAESRVKLMRSLLEDGEIEKKELKKIRILYADTRAEINAGLDRLLIEMEATGSKGKVGPFARVAESAGKYAGNFIKACDKLIFGEERGPLKINSELVKPFADALIDIWKTIGKGKSDRYSHVKNRIELLKWEKFDKIN